MKWTLYIILILLLPIKAFGQIIPVSDQYVLNPLLINPAYAGERGALNIGSFYRMQWAGVTGAPETLTVTADAPLFNNRVGLGLMLINDNVGVSTENQLTTDYAFKINIKEGTLSFGLGATVVSTNTAWSKLIPVDAGDEEYLVDSKTYIVPNFSYGMYYTINNFYAGFSVPKFLNYKFNFDRNKYYLKVDPYYYTYLLTTGYSFSLSKNIRMVPSTLINYSPSRKMAFDLNTYFNFYDRFWVGASYRNNRSITGLFQLHIDKQLKLAYSYDFNIGELSKFGNGSHGIMMRSTFSYKLDAVNPLIF